MTQNEVKIELEKFADPEKTKILKRFFKTGKGEYGEGDIFIGVKVPDQRKVAIKFKNLAMDETVELLHSPIHEHRLTALLIWVQQFKVGDDKKRNEIFNTYLKNTKYINNWDLVDLSSEKVVGQNIIFFPELKPNIYRICQSKSVWDRRIAIMATFAFIRQNQFNDTLKMAQILLYDKHDLIQKAVGWMLREIGNRDKDTEQKFLKIFYKKMPRTTLRYAIEKFDEKERKFYLNHQPITNLTF